MKEIKCSGCGEMIAQPFPKSRACPKCGTDISKSIIEFERELRRDIREMKRAVRALEPKRKKTSISFDPEIIEMINTASRIRTAKRHPVKEKNEIVEDAIREYVEKYRLKKS